MEKDALQHALPFEAVEELADMNTFSSSTYGNPLLKPELRNTKMSTISMAPECRQHITGQCERFGRYSSILGNAYRSNLPKQSAKAVQQTVAEIDRIMLDAEIAVQERMSRLRREVDEFERNVSEYSDDRWYRNIADLTANEYSDFHEVISTMRIRDFDDFANYLKDMLPAAANEARPFHESSGHAFTGKVRNLLDIALRSASHSTAFSLLATVKAKVFVLNRARVPPRHLERLVADIDARLLQMLDVHSNIDDKDEYWDFASSWRLLVTSWEDMASDAGPLLRVLDPIRKKAEKEIQYRSSLAVSRRLPQELADLIFEWAMVVEEVPLEA